MLESDALILILEPWDHPQSRNRKRRIRNAAGMYLGFADWRPAWTLPIIGRWSWPIVRVFETEDASLVCTVFQRSTQRWEVFDAENRLVGACQYHLAEGTRIDDAFGRPVAWLIGKPGTSHRRIGGPDGGEIGSVHQMNEQSRLEFDPDSEVSPFVKMVLVAAVIVER